MINSIVLAIFAIIFGLSYAYEWQELWYPNMPIDHFSFSDQRTFSLRYLLNTDYWDSRHSGPIFVYCGNEDRIEEFAELTGYIWDIAPEFKAMVVFIEHRYYGKSLPFGNQSFVNLYNLGKLSSEQALADFVILINSLKENIPGALDSPVVAFGGSYGGLLSAWLRIKYPHVVIGSIASSAPVLIFEGLSSCSAFYETVTRTFRNSGRNCDKTIRNSWDAIRRSAKTAQGRYWMNRNLKLCRDNFLTMPEHAEILISRLGYDYSAMAMSNYPYPTKLFNAVPGWPVKEACKFLTNPYASDKDIIMAVFNADMVYRNFSGDLACVQYFKQRSSINVRDEFPQDPIDFAYRFQTCTEIITPMCRTGTTDMFEFEEWNLDNHIAFCRANYFGATGRPYWVNTNYGGNKLIGATNIVFTNGDMDPWIGGSLTERLPGMDPSIIIQTVRDGAHHYDLRGAHPLDTASVRTARDRMKNYIRKWIYQANRESLVSTGVVNPTDSVKKPETLPPTGFAPPFWLTQFPWYQPQEDREKG